ncbi:N-6 DNA methylase [Crossiella sp. CA198]|uniref:N-6 DNA methylase n=1 Tax=Crossiella sp. CA198 TaxID=3455607 RepID=UPI003F8D2DB6
MSEWTVPELVAYFRHTWRSIIRSRPEVTHLVYPVISWIFDDSQASVHPHAHAVARAALDAGQPDLTGTDRRFDTDLLGQVLVLLRPKSALQARGQFYTPSDIAALLAGMSTVEEHCTVLDPMMGTGGMFRAAAAVMREQGRDPHTVSWVGCDIDETAVACATVNSMIWGLGRDIVFHAGDALTPDWETHARAQRDELRRLASGIERDQRLIAALTSM